jgi:hypothetical protein
MSILAAAALRRVGKLVGGDEGRTMVAASNARMTEQEVVDPSRLAHTLAG